MRRPGAGRSASCIGLVKYGVVPMGDPNVHTRSQLYWNALLKIPAQVVAFAISIVVARILTPADYGIMGIAMMLIGFSNLLTDFGFSSAIVQRQVKDSDSLYSVFTLNLAISTALAAGFVLASNSIANFFRSPECRSVVVVMSSFFVITSFSAVPRAILSRDLRFKTLSLVDAMSAITMSVATLMLALAGLRYWALAFGQLLPAAFFACYLCIAVRWLPVIRFRRSSLSPLLHFSAWSFAKTQITFGLNQLDRVLLGRFSGVVSLGFYDKARSVAAVPSDSFLAGVNAVLFSSFSQRKHDDDDVRGLLKKGLMATSLLSFPLYVGLCLVAKPFVMGLMGEKWAPMVVPFQVITASYAIRSIGGLLASVNVGIGRYQAHTVRYSIAGAVFALSCAVLLRYGVTGISAAFLVFAVTSVGLTLHLAVAATGVRWGEVLRALRPATAATLVMSGVTWLLSRVLAAPTIANLFLLSGVGAVAYVLCLAVEREPGFLLLRRAVISDWAGLMSPKTREF